MGSEELACWLLDDPEGTRLSLRYLAKLGIFTHTLESVACDPGENAQLDHLINQGAFVYRDLEEWSKVSKARQDDYQQEHLHDEDEVHFFTAGSAFVDVRDKGDNWVRLHCVAGDFLCLPRGMYHRIAPDPKSKNKSFEALRLNRDDPPVWTCFPRNEETEQREGRVEYVDQYIDEGKSTVPFHYLVAIAVGMFILLVLVIVARYQFSEDPWVHNHQNEHTEKMMDDYFQQKAALAAGVSPEVAATAAEGTAAESAHDPYDF